MTKTVPSVAILFSFVALASIGCSVQTGTESEIDTSQAALRPAPDSPPDTDTMGTTATKTKVTVPSNCVATGGHDPYSGEPSYHCKQKDGTLRLCSESDIRDKVAGCTALIFAPSDITVARPAVLQ